MKLLLCSDFKNIGYKFLDKFFDLNQKHKCLFINYASEDYEIEDASESSSFERIQSLNFDVTILSEKYKFDEDLDMIFVRGGNTTKLIHLLKKFNHFEKIKELTKNGVLYVGESAGSVLAGSDTEWTLRAEPYDYDVKAEFGEDSLLGYNFVDKMIFVHCSKYRFPFSGEIPDGRIVRLPNREFYGDYLKDIKIYPKGTYITLGNNQVFYENDSVGKILSYDWSKIPVQK